MNAFKLKSLVFLSKEDCFRECFSTKDCSMIAFDEKEINNENCVLYDQKRSGENIECNNALYCENFVDKNEIVLKSYEHEKNYCFKLFIDFKLEALNLQSRTTFLESKIECHKGLFI